MDLDVALFDVDVGRAVLAHRAELDDVAVGHVLAHGEHQVERADHVGLLREDGVMARLHRERRRRLLGVVDHHVGQQFSLVVQLDFAFEVQLRLDSQPGAGVAVEDLEPLLVDDGVLGAVRQFHDARQIASGEHRDRDDIALHAEGGIALPRERRLPGHRRVADDGGGV